MGSMVDDNLYFSKPWVGLYFAVRKMSDIITLYLVLFVSKIAVEAAQSESSDNQECNTKAICNVENGTVHGVINLSVQGSSVGSPVLLQGQVSGLSQGLHGFHVHQYGDLSNGCASTGGHYNPFDKEHGAPEDTNRHAGDLGNIEARDNGVAEVNIVDRQVKLCGPTSVIGRAIVVHAKKDDLGQGGNDESKKTGNAGPRVGCCVIKVVPN